MPKESRRDIGGEEDCAPCPESCKASRNLLIIYKQQLHRLLLMIDPRGAKVFFLGYTAHENNAQWLIM
jgi:hypothetical protein